MKDKSKKNEEVVFDENLNRYYTIYKGPIIEN